MSQGCLYTRFAGRELVVWFFFPVIFIGGGLWLAARYVKERDQGHASVSWMRIPGTIESVLVLPKIGMEDPGDVTVIYRYSVHGISYRSKRVAFGSTTRQGLMARAERYHPGEAVEVFVDPQNATTAVIETGQRPGSLLMPTCGIALIIIGALIGTYFLWLMRPHAPVSNFAITSRFPLSLFRTKETTMGFSSRLFGEAPAPSGGPVLGPEEETDANLTGKRILVVEESIIIQKVIELSLEGATVVGVKDSDAAIKKLTSGSFDLVICAVILSPKTGYDLCAWVKTLHPATPVILLRGSLEPFDENRAKRAKPDAVLTSPFDPKTLVGEVGRVLSSRGSYK